LNCVCALILSAGLARAASALLYVIIELAKRAYSPKSTFAGRVIGILLMYIADLLLSI